MKLVLIEWMDSHAGRGWQDKEKLQAAATPLYCRSVGWVVSGNKKCKVIVPHISVDSEMGAMIQGCGDLTIPTKAIVRLTILRHRLDK